jgi:hypothetical protein
MKRMKPVTMMQIIKHPLVQIFQRKMERIMKQMVLSFFFLFFECSYLVISCTPALEMDVMHKSCSI